MSYGRSPYYIIGTDIGGVDCFEFFGDAQMGEDFSAAIRGDAMAQFIATMWKHDHPTATEPPRIGGELGALIRRGFKVRPDLRENWHPLVLTDSATVTEIAVDVPVADRQA